MFSIFHRLVDQIDQIYILYYMMIRNPQIKPKKSVIGNMNDHYIYM